MAPPGWNKRFSNVREISGVGFQPASKQLAGWKPTPRTDRTLISPTMLICFAQSAAER
jgi:hypothetical protein